MKKIYKKLTSVLLALIFLFGTFTLIPLTSAAETFDDLKPYITSGEFDYEKLNDGTATEDYAAENKFTDLNSPGEPTEPTEKTDFLIGDVNGDGILDISDVTYLQMYLAGYKNNPIDESDSVEFATADFEQNGLIDISDATAIQMRLAGYGAANPSTEPSSTEPSSTEPSSTEPSSIEPTSTEPSSTEPSSTEPTSTEPTSTEPTPTAATSDFDGTTQGQIFNLVNKERANVGLSPLVYDERLAGYAQIRAEEIVEEFSHTRPDGTICFTVIPESDPYTAFGENIAFGFSSAEEVMNGWMNSESHRANILKDIFTNIGIGFITVDGMPYYVQFFGTIKTQ